MTWSDGEISPISSRNIVPPSANSNLPGLADAAPVKAPFSYPKSSLSRRLSGMAPQFTFIIGLSFLLLQLCIAVDITSLPVPVSPRISTVTSDWATFLASASTSCIAGLLLLTFICSILVSLKGASPSASLEATIFLTAFIISLISNGFVT